MTYKIIRFHREKKQKIVARGLSIQEAKEHCSREDTHKWDSKGVLWFDGYTQEGVQ